MVHTKNILNREIDIYISEDDAGTVHFCYPKAFSDNSILTEIRLEIGAMAAWTPTTAERTFWEKATILHQESNRPEGSIIPDRYSRHYYDLYCMSKTDVFDKALQLPELLDRVAEFKRKFYPRN